MSIVVVATRLFHFLFSAKKWHQVSALDWLKPFLEYSMQSCFTTSKNLEKSWLFSIDPFHHLQFTWFWSINHPCCRTPRTSNLGVSDPHEILRLKVPAVVAIPVLKNSRQRVQYVEMRKPHFHSTSFSTCQTWLQRAGINNNPTKKWPSGRLVLNRSREFFQRHPWKLTCPLKWDYFNRKYIFQPLIFRGHVSFPGSRWLESQQPLIFKSLSRKSLTPWPPSSLGNS